MWPFLLIAGGVAAFSLVNLGVAGARLLINPQGIRIRSGKLVCAVEFTNPSRQEFKIEYVFADVKAGENVVGTIREENAESRYVIPKERSATFQIPIKPSTASIIPALFKIILSGQKPMMIVNGYYKVNGIRVPLEMEIPLAA